MIALTFAMVSNCANAQSQIDSLQRQLLVTTDTSRVKVFVRLAYEHALIENRQALSYIDSAMALSAKLGYQEGKMQCYIYLGKHHWKRDLDSATHFYTEALEISEALRKNTATAQLLNEIGNCHLTQGNLNLATGYFMQCRAMCEKIGNKKGMAIALVNLGVISRRLGQYEQAESYFHASTVIATEIKFEAMIAFNKNQRGIMLAEKGMYSEAIDLHKQALFIFQNLNDNLSASRSIASIGSCYAALGENRNAIEYFQRSIAMYEKLGVANKYDVFLNLADAYRSIGSFADAQAQIRRASDIATKTKNKKGLADIGMFEGQLCFSQGDYEAALAKYIGAHKLYEELHDPEGMANVLLHFGRIYEAQNDFKKALVTYNKVLVLNSNNGHPDQKAEAIQAIGKICLKNGNLDAAEENFKKALAIRKVLGNQLHISTVQTDIGHVYYMRHRYSEALSELQSALTIQAMEKQNMDKAHTLILLSRTYTATGKIDDAIHNLRTALASALSFENIVDAREASELLADLFARRSNFSEAFHYKSIASNFKDSLYSVEKEKALRKLQASFEMQQQLKENEILKRDNLIIEKDLKKQYILSIAEGVGFVLMVLATALLYRDNKNKKTIVKQRDEILHFNQELSKRNLELDELNKEKNRYMGMIAHDLRSPLNHVKGLVNLFQISSNKFTSEQERYLELINESVQRQLNMITRILDGDAIDSHQINITMTEVNLTKVVVSAMETFAHVAEKKQIMLKANITAIPCVIEADEGYLTQVLENLVSNALKFSPMMKEITIQMRDEGDVFVTEIKDQGPGISAEDMKKMFQPYTRLSAKPTAGEKSTGLGLAIVKKYIEAMNGTVWCTSEMGKGTSFFISLRKPNQKQAAQRNIA